MARRLRLIVPGYPLHIVQRGHDRAPCFFKDAERELYLGLMSTYSRQWSCDVHAYVLMTNHVHVLLTPRTVEGPSRFMKDVNQRFAQFMNRKYARVGSLWQGRFHSSLIQSDAYFLACQRYIEANPVRARMAAHPLSYRWSSARHNAAGIPSPLLVAHPTYLALGDDDHSRRASYRTLCDSEVDFETLARLRSAVQMNLPLGSDAFIEEMESLSGVPAGRRRRGPLIKQAGGKVMVQHARLGSDPELI
ncbi:MAG TPA: transposase [Ramlibacter sp.]|nr:transposase [Ramlibacter sp.]